MVEFQEETGHMYNLEATPAEGTTYRFAREDRKRYVGIIQRIVEVQGTGEKVAYDRAQMDALLDLGQAGIEQLVALQREVTGYEG